MKYQVQILSVDKMDKHEGTVQFGLKGKEYKAFFFGEDYEPGQSVEVEFDHLEYPLEWNLIFNENKGKELKLEQSKDIDWSYYGYGKIIAIDPVIADFGDIQLELGKWTNDLKVIGEFIYWKVERLDIRKTKE